MKPGNCRLCEKQRKLCFSHVYPELLYKDLYDETGRFVCISSHPYHSPREFQKGFREHLLCRGCEGIINDYETPTDNTLERLKAAPREGRIASYRASFQRTGNETHARLNTQRKILATMWGLWERGTAYNPKLFYNSKRTLKVKSSG